MSRLRYAAFQDKRDIIEGFKFSFEFTVEGSQEGILHPMTHQQIPPTIQAIVFDKDGTLIRQASAWLPGRAPEPLPLQDLEQSDAIRWVDIYGDAEDGAGVLALLAPICRGALKHRMVRDLITPKRFATGGRYGDSPVTLSSGFRIRHLQPGADEGAPVGADGVTSVFEPVQLLVGDDWLLSCWLPPRAAATEPTRLPTGQLGRA